MKFHQHLKKAMQDLQLTQAQVVGMTGISKSGISQYISGKHEPSEDKKSHIALALGLTPDYFEQDEVPVIKLTNESAAIPKLLPTDAAKLMGINHQTVRRGLQQGVFPWGYAIHTKKDRWVYFINAHKFAEIEGITL